MKITISVEGKNKDDEAKMLAKIAEQISLAIGSSGVEEIKAASAMAVAVTRPSSKGKPAGKKATEARMAVENLAKRKWQEEGFTANELAQYLGCDRYVATNALIYHSGEGGIVYRAGVAPRAADRGKHPVLWKWTE